MSDVENKEPEEQEDRPAEDSPVTEGDKESFADRARRVFKFGTPSEMDVEEAAVEQTEVEAPVSSELEDAREEAKQNFDKYLRAVAELENFKKRTAKERAELLRYAGEHLAVDVIGVLDDLERAAQQEATGSAEDILKGVKLIYDRFVGVLEKHSIKGVEAIGGAFDPGSQEALAIVPTADHAADTVMEQFRKAFFFKDKLIRTAQVVVAAPLIQQEVASEE